MNNTFLQHAKSITVRCFTPLTNTNSLSDQGANTIALENESISLKQFGLCLINEGNNRIQVHAGPTYAN